MSLMCIVHLLNSSDPMEKTFMNSLGNLSIVISHVFMFILWPEEPSFCFIFYYFLILQLFYFFSLWFAINYLISYLLIGLSFPGYPFFKIDLLSNSLLFFSLSVSPILQGQLPILSTCGKFDRYKSLKRANYQEKNLPMVTHVWNAGLGKGSREVWDCFANHIVEKVQSPCVYLKRNSWKII